MNWDNLLELCLVSGAYLLVFVLIPFWVRGFRLSGDNVMDHLVSSCILANIVIINCVLLLSLVGIYYRFTLVIALLAIVAVYRFLIKRDETMRYLQEMERYFVNYRDGYLHRDVLRHMIVKKIAGPFQNAFAKTKNPLYLLIILLAFANAAYTRAYHVIVNMYYGTSDMYAHTEWISNLNMNNPFSSGVYPFGMHSAISVINVLFRIDLVTVIRMFGPMVGMLIVFSLYYVLRKSFRSRLAVSFAMIFYCVLDVFNPLAVERQMLTLPQEYGMIFMYLAGYFLYRYIKDAERMSLALFAASVAMTLMAHFYITLYTVVLCGALFLTSLARMRKKVFAGLVIGVICSLLAALLPMGIGVAKGIRLENSLYWALGLIESGADETIGADGETEPAEEKSYQTGDLTVTKALLKNPLKAMDDAYFFDNTRLNSSGMLYEWFLIFAASTAVGLLYPLFKCKNTVRRWDIMGYSLYAALVFGIRAMPIFNLPAILEYHRMCLFFIFAVPLTLAAPLELLYDIFHSFGKAAVYAHMCVATVFTGALGYYIADGAHYGMLCNTIQMQYNGAVIAYYNITKSYDNLTWTIISTNDEYSLCLQKGYHYTLTDFVIFMNEYDARRELTIPTEYVFLYIDKKPQEYAWSFPVKEPREYPALDPEDVYAPIDELIELNRENDLYVYKDLDANRIFQAKANAWAQAYMRYFPDEMDIYYEDDEIIVYRLRQNTYALNNLSIPYEGNLPAFKEPA